MLDCEFMKSIQTKTKEWEDLADKLFEMTEEPVFDPSKHIDGEDCKVQGRGKSNSNCESS